MTNSRNTRNSNAGWTARGRVHYGSLGDGRETALKSSDVTRLGADPYDVAIGGAGVVVTCPHFWYHGLC